MSKNNLLNDQRGTFMLITAVLVLMFFTILAVMVDVGRWSRGKEELQAAGDAASLSAALSAERYVELELERGYEILDECCGEDGCHACCKPYCLTPGKTYVSGKEVDLIEKNGWQNYCCSTYCGGCSYKIIDRWVQYKDGGSIAKANANLVFGLNKPKEMSASVGSMEIIDKKSNPAYPSVFVRPKGDIKAKMINFLGIETLKASTCSQGRTYYKEIKNKKETNKWQVPPSSACEEL